MAGSRIVAVTVDHRLRAESGAEAEGVSRLAASLGIQHRILPIRWGTGAFPPCPHLGRSEAPARTARLALYHELMTAEDIDTLWMGHHRDDQVENLLLWGYGMKGVAKLAAAPDGKSRWIVRPLLKFDKVRLVATCHSHSLPFFTDPTNLEPNHTPRNSLRAQIASAQLSYTHNPSSVRPTGGPLALLRRLAADADVVQAPLPPALLGLLRRHVPHFSTVSITPSSFPPATRPDTVRTLLRRAIALVAPASATVSRDALERLRTSLWLPDSSNTTRISPGGGVIFSRALGVGPSSWTISRQKARRDAGNRRLALTAGEWTKWDGRIFLRVSGDQGSSWAVEERGSFGAPVVLRLRAGHSEEAVLNFETLRRDKMPWLDEGNWTSGGVAIDWRCSTPTELPRPCW